MILNLFMVKFYQGDNQAADLEYKSICVLLILLKEIKTQSKLNYSVLS